MKPVFLFLLGVIISGNLFGQAGRVDLTFQPDRLNTGRGLDGTVVTSFVQHDGKILLGGNFNFFNGKRVNGIFRLNPDGTVDDSFNCPSKPMFISSISVQGDGKILVAGNFSTFENIELNGIARLNIDGSLDKEFLPELAQTNYKNITSISIQDDRKIILGGVGDFLTLDGKTSQGLIRLDADGKVDTSFKSPLIEYSRVRDIIIQADCKILIAGSLKLENGQIEVYVTRLNRDGSLDQGFQNSVIIDKNEEFFNARVLAIHEDGKIVVGGNFDRFGQGPNGNMIVRLNSDGTIDQSFDPGSGFRKFDGSVREIIPLPDGKVIVGGDFYLFDGTLNNGVVRLNQDGSLDSSFAQEKLSPLEDEEAYVSTISLLKDGGILVGGRFSFFAGNDRNHLAVLHDHGQLSDVFAPFGPNGYVLNIVSQRDEKIIVTGDFNRFNNQPNNGIVRLFPNGELDSMFNVPQFPPDAYGFGNKLSIQQDGKIVVAGSFSINHTPHGRIFRLNEDGTFDPSLDVDFGPWSSTRDISIQSNGKIVALANASIYMGALINGIIRLNPDGVRDSSFNPGKGPNAQPIGLIVQPDEKIIIFGNFSSYDGVSIKSIARVNTDGSLDTSFKAQLDNYSGVNQIVLQSDGKLIVAGYTFQNGDLKSSILRLNSDGTLDSGFDVGSGPNSWVGSMVVQPDRKIILAGGFSSFDGFIVNRIARINPNGSLDQSFDTGTGPDAYIEAVHLQEDGRIIIGGAFFSFDGISRVHIARLLNDVEVACQTDISVRPEVLLCLDEKGKARLTTEMVDKGSCSTCGPISWSFSKCDFTCEDLGEQSVEVLATDQKGNVSKVQVKVLVQDQTSPKTTIDNQSFVWIIQSGDTFTMPDFRSAIGAFDNCSFNIIQIPAPGTVFDQPQNTKICFEVEDGSGNKTAAHLGFSLVVLEIQDMNENDRRIENKETGKIHVPWNTSLEDAVGSGVRFANGSDPNVVSKIVWKSEDYDRYKPGDYRLTATIKNTFIEGMDPFVNLIVKVDLKPLADDIIISNNVVPRNVRKKEIIGTLKTIDLVDHIHIYSMEPHPDFYIEQDVLVWNGDGQPPFETRLMISSTDRAGQVFKKVILIQRELSKSTDVLIFPNPASDYLSIEFKLPETTSFSWVVYNAQGKLMHHSEFEDATSFIETLDLRNYSPGIYFIQINDGISKRSYKFVKR